MNARKPIKSVIKNKIILENECIHGNRLLHKKIKNKNLMAAEYYNNNNNI